MSDLTREELIEIESRAEKARELWVRDGEGQWVTMTGAYCQHYSRDVPQLLDEIQGLREERRYLHWIIRDLQWMARRYVDGRWSYVVSVFNGVTRKAKELGVELHPADGTIWARDGMGRAYDELTDEEAAEGPPGPASSTNDRQETL